MLQMNCENYERPESVNPHRFNAEILAENDILFPEFSPFEKIYRYGVGNSYPDIIRALVIASASASSGLDVAQTFLKGKGLNGFDDFKVNSKETLTELVAQIAEQIIIFNGFAIQINFNALGRITDMRAVPFERVRIGKIDDEGHAPVAYIKNWERSEEKPKRVHLFNPLPEVIKAQMTDKEGFNGQLLYWKQASAGEIYPISRLHPVIYDMDAEAQASKYKRNSIRGGFFGKNVFVTPPFDDDAGGELQKFRQKLRSFFGVDNIDSVLHIQAENFGDTLDAVFKVLEIKPNINDKLFAYTESSARANIMARFKNVPEILLRNPDASLFGVGSEVIKNAEKFYERQWATERSVIESKIRQLLSLWDEPVKDLANFKIETFYNETDN